VARAEQSNGTARLAQQDVGPGRRRRRRRRSGSAVAGRGGTRTRTRSGRGWQEIFSWLQGTVVLSFS